MRITKRNISLPKGRHGEDGCRTLYLVVSGRRQRSWVQRLHVGGKRIDRGLGSTEFVTLEEARRIAHQNRLEARRGSNPFLQDQPEEASAAPQSAVVRAHENPTEKPKGIA